MSAPPEKARVLIVDDTRFHRELARDALVDQLAEGFAVAELTGRAVLEDDSA